MEQKYLSDLNKYGPKDKKNKNNLTHLGQLNKQYAFISFPLPRFSKYNKKNKTNISSNYSNSKNQQQQNDNAKLNQSLSIIKDHVFNSKIWNSGLNLDLSMTSQGSLYSNQFDQKDSDEDSYYIPSEKQNLDSFLITQQNKLSQSSIYRINNNQSQFQTSSQKAKLRKEIKKINISDEFLEQLLGESYDDINKSKSLLKKLQNTSNSNENSNSEETSNSELESEDESDNDVLEVPDLIPRFKFNEKGRQGDQNFKKLQKQRTVTEHIINRKNAVSINQMFKNKKRQNTQFVSPKEFNTLFNKEIDKQQLDIQEETEDQDDHEQSQDTDQAKEFIQKFNQNQKTQIIEEVLNDSRSTIQYDRSQRASSNFTLGANTKAQHILNNRQSYGQRKIKNSLVGQQTQFD